MAAKVARGIGGVEVPFVRILADEVFHSPGFAAPGRVLPGTTYGRDVGEPRHLTCDALEFRTIAEFPRSAGALDYVQAQLAGKFLRLPVGIQRTDVGNIRRNSGDRGQQQMVVAP